MNERTASRAALRVQTLFFAAYRELIGSDELEVELARPATVSDLVRTLQRRAPALPAAPLVAVNQRYAAPDTLLEDGDEVAFIPPVAGG